MAAILAPGTGSALTSADVACVLVHIDLDGDRPHPSSVAALAAGRAVASSWGATLYAALVVAKRIQDMMRKTVFLAEDGLNLNVRCSMGLATYPEDAKSSHEIIRQADEMMYMVKNSSRDNIAVAQQGILK